MKTSLGCEPHRVDGVLAVLRRVPVDALTGRLSFVWTLWEVAAVHLTHTQHKHKYTLMQAHTHTPTHTRIRAKLIV